MKVVFDEGVPRDLLAELRSSGLEVIGFPSAWAGTKNGQLMRLIGDAGYQCFVTCDKNLPYQQNLTRLPFAVVVLPTNKRDDLLGLAERIVAAISVAYPGVATWVDR